MRFVRREDIEGDHNRGWRVDCVDLVLDSEIRGYLKISYIPHERFKRYYPTIFNGMSQIQGKCILPYDDRGRHYKTFSLEEAQIFCKNIQDYRYRIDCGSTSTLPELQAAFKKLESDVKKRYGDDFKSFIDFHVDKPFVDYVTRNNDFRGKGLLRGLYIEGAKWMAERDMVLHASGLQEAGAKRAWDYMDKDGLVAVTKSGRRFIVLNNAAD